MNKLGLKTLAVVAVTIGLLVPLALIRGLIAERTGYRAEAREEVGRSWTGPQTVVGPLLVVPPAVSGAGTEQAGPCLFVLPESLEVRSSLSTETRKRGLYEVPVYTTRLAISGEFVLPGSLRAGAGLDPDSAFVAFSFSDNRGIVEQPTLAWGSTEAEFIAGSWLPGGSEGVHADVGPLDLVEGGRYPFRVEVELRGLESLQFAPVARSTHVLMEAEWPHPSFIGRFLPVEHEIDGERFTAEWRVSGLAGGLQQGWQGDVASAKRLDVNRFGVSLINPVDIYQQAERSVKYGGLIVLLTFTAFCLVEIVSRLMLHPIQYLLVGLALVIFFLLLIALSEHMPFVASYLVSASACVGLIGVYVVSALRSAVHGLSLTASLGGLYAMLYAILVSEDNALLMGTLLLFAALAAVMLVTRRIDWYALGNRLAPESPAPDVPAGGSH